MPILIGEMFFGGGTLSVGVLKLRFVVPPSLRIDLIESLARAYSAARFKRHSARAPFLLTSSRSPGGRKHPARIGNEY